MRSGFHVVDLNVRGELLTTQHYGYEQLEQVAGAQDLIVLFATLLWRTPQQFEAELPPSTRLRVRWRASSQTSGILTLRFDEELASLSLLASGMDPEADRITFQAFQRHLVRALHGTENEPAFALMHIQQRPVVATINFASPPDPADCLIAALSDRCFAAAYFRFQNLA